MTGSGHSTSLPGQASVTRLLLGTASPRRHRIVSDLGVPFDVVRPDVEETHDEADAVGTAALNAFAKHLWCRQRHPGRWLLTADTVVEFEGRCLGKPRDAEEAVRWLHAYSGKVQHVFTAVVLSVPDGAPALRVAASSLRFKPLTEQAARDYLAVAHTLDRAGGYDIDTCGDRIIADHVGSFTNIMGLPAEVVADWLRAQGFPP